MKEKSNEMNVKRLSAADVKQLVVQQQFDIFQQSQLWTLIDND